MSITEMDSDARVNLGVMKDSEAPGSPSHEKEAEGNEEHASASHRVVSEEVEEAEEDVGGGEEEEEGKDSKENPAPPSSYTSAPTTATQPSTSIASPANVASLSTNSPTPANVATPIDFVATPTNIATYMSSPVCLASLQLSGVIATLQSVVTSQGPYHTHLPSSSAMTPSFELSDRFWNGEGSVPVFQGSFTDLLSDAIPPPFDISTNWSTQAGWTGYSPTASYQTQTQPTLFMPYQPPPFDFRSQVDLTGYSAGPGVATHQTQTTSFTPHQPL